MTIAVQKRYEAVLHTAQGDLTILLLPDVAPHTVNSFVFLARDGFYDGCTFHRVIPAFVAQAGDPTGWGSGGPGYTIPDELSERPFAAGAVGMANAGPNTNGSQFFITLADALHLTGRYTLFGELREGMAALQSLAARDPAADANLPAGDRISSVEIIEG